MDVLHEEGKGILAAIRLTRFADRAGRRIGPERLVVSPAVIVAGQPKTARRPEDQQRGRKRKPTRPPTRSRPEPTVGRVAEKLRRIERREVRSRAIVHALKRRPGRVDNEARQPEEREQRLHPPRVRPHGLAEPAPSQGGICVGHGSSSSRAARLHARGWPIDRRMGAENQGMSNAWCVVRGA